MLVTTGLEHETPSLTLPHKGARTSPFPPLWGKVRMGVIIPRQLRFTWQPDGYSHSMDFKNGMKAD